MRAQQLTINGLNFGALNNTSVRVANVTIGGRTCPITSNNHTLLTCTVPAGTGVLTFVGNTCELCTGATCGGEQEPTCRCS